MLTDPANRPESDSHILAGFLWLTVKENLKEMEIEISINEILTLKKESFSKIVKQKVREKALETLNSSKEKHSKMKHLEYEELKIKKYLKENVNKADELFRFRTRMVELRGNFKSKYNENILCELCQKYEEY